MIKKIIFNSVFICAFNANAQIIFKSSFENNSSLGPGSATNVVINNVLGNVTNGSIITITGLNFTTKENAAPLFWWKADMGTIPSSGLSRKNSWDGAFSGEISSVITAPGSTQAVRWDHGLSTGAALGKVEFGSNKTRIYLHRKLHEDFDVVENIALRTRVTGVLCADINIGDTITGGESGATGVVRQVVTETTRCGVFYNNIDGTINNEFPVDFIFGESMATSTTTMTNSEGSIAFPNGILRTFNYKTIRYWNLDTRNNTFIGAQGAHNADYNIGREFTDGTLFYRDFLNPISQIPFQWLIQEVFYQVSSEVGVSDALWLFFMNGILASDRPFVDRNADHPEPYSSIFQSQVSNGAQPGSFVYYDSLYIDDSWHHVVICAGNTESTCTDREIQIPTAWSDTSITVEVNLGGLDATTPLYLYVIDENGGFNAIGKQITP